MSSENPIVYPFKASSSSSGFLLPCTRLLPCFFELSRRICTDEDDAEDTDDANDDDDDDDDAIAKS